MLRILQWGVVPSLCGGVETFVMNVYRNIDREQIQFDFLLYEGSEKLFFEDEILALGGHIYREYKRVKRYPISHYVYIDRFFAKHPEIRGVHYHATALFDIDVIKAAKRHNLPVRIVHSHNTGYDKEGTRWYLNLLDAKNRKNLNRYVTQQFACSREAGKWMFGDFDFKIIKNGIDIQKYCFDKKERKRLREKLNMEDKIMCILVGRLELQKNPIFALKLIKKVKDKIPQIQCVFVGEGVLRKEMERFIAENCLETNVQIMGNRADVASLLSAADIFLFPSLYEGFSIAALEAQTSGLLCIISDRVPQSAVISDIVLTVKLDEMKEWEKSLLNCITRLSGEEDIEPIREQAFMKIKKAGYDIIDTAMDIQSIYLNAI